MPITRITTMLLVCRQEANVMITKTRISGISCARSDIFSGWVGVVLGHWEGGGSDGDDVI